MSDSHQIDPTRTDWDQWAGPEELALRLNIPLATVYGWRSRGGGPIGHRIGRHVRYRPEDIEAWLAHCRDPEPRGGVTTTTA